MNIKELLRKRTENIKMSPDEHLYLMNHVGHFTRSQLLSVLKTGSSDYLRDAARDELIARSAAFPHWTIVPIFWLVIAGIVVGITTGIISWFAWQRPVPSRPSSSAPHSQASV